MRKPYTPRQDARRRERTIRPIIFAAYKLLEERGPLTKEQMAADLHVQPNYIAQLMSQLGIAGLVAAKQSRNRHWYECVND